MVRPLPDRRRGHPDGGDAGRHRLDVGDVSRVPGDRRPPAQGDQLRRLYRPFRPAHVRHGQARPLRDRHRGRSRPHGGGGEGGDPRRRDGLFQLARDDPRHARQYAGREPYRRLVGGRSAGRRHGRARCRHLPDRARYLGRRGTAELPRAAPAGGRGDGPAGDVRHHLEPPGRQPEPLDLPARVSRRVRRRRRARLGADHHPLHQRHLLAQIVPALRRAAGLARATPPAARGAEATPRRSGDTAATGRGGSKNEAPRQRLPGRRRRDHRSAQAGLREPLRHEGRRLEGPDRGPACRRCAASIRSR